MSGTGLRKALPRGELEDRAGGIGRIIEEQIRRIGRSPRDRIEVEINAFSRHGLAKPPEPLASA